MIAVAAANPTPYTPAWSEPFSMALPDPGLVVSITVPLNSEHRNRHPASQFYLLSSNEASAFCTLQIQGSSQGVRCVLPESRNCCPAPAQAAPVARSHGTRRSRALRTPRSLGVPAIDSSSAHPPLSAQRTLAWEESSSRAEQ